jgi:hypothetical protein
MADLDLGPELPQEPERPVHRVQQQPQQRQQQQQRQGTEGFVRRSVRVLVHRRWASLRRRRGQEKLSVPRLVMTVLAFVALFASWSWFRNESLPWIGVGPCRLAFLLALGLAVVFGLLFAMNVLDVVAAREREQQREAEQAAEKDGQDQRQR